MRQFFAVLALVGMVMLAGSAAQAEAPVSEDTLSQMGIHNMQVVSDAEGDTIRGLGRCPGKCFNIRIPRVKCTKLVKVEQADVSDVSRSAFVKVNQDNYSEVKKSQKVAIGQYNGSDVKKSAFVKIDQDNVSSVKGSTKVSVAQENLSSIKDSSFVKVTQFNISTVNNSLGVKVNQSNTSIVR